jgi:hypothetical protein
MNEAIMPMHHGSAEDLSNLHVLKREKFGHCFNGFGFYVLYVLMSMNF